MALSEIEVQSLRDQIRELSAQLIANGDEEILARLRSGELDGEDGFHGEDEDGEWDMDDNAPEYRYAHDLAAADGAGYESSCSGSYYSLATPDPMHYGLPDDVEVEMECMDGHRPVRIYRPKLEE